MGLEAADLNDGAILGATRQERHDNGACRFHITLPSGRELHSEWIAQDNLKKAVFSWCEAVRAEAVADSDAANREAKEAALQRRRSEQLAAPPAAVAGVHARTSAEPAADPADFARSQLALLELEVAHWQMALSDAQDKLRGALKARDKWAAVVETLSTYNEVSNEVPSDHS